VAIVSWSCNSIVSDGSVGRRRRGAVALNLQQFAASRQDDWTRLHDLVGAAAGSPGQIGASAMLDAGRLYRSAAADLAYARRRFPGDPVTRNLEALVARAHTLVYGSVVDREGIWWFVHRGYWRRVRERPVPLWLAIGLVVSATLGAGLWAHHAPVQAVRVIPQFAHAAGQSAPDPDKHFGADASTGFAAQIFTNNMQVAFVAFAGGLTLGLLTGWVLVLNGLMLGLLGGVELANGNGSVFFQLIVPHGLLEMSLFIVAGAAGFRMAGALLRPGHRRRVDALVVEGRAAVEVAFGTAMLLIPCGIVEGFVTPAGWGLGPNVTIGVILFLAFWGLVVWRGRPEPRPATLSAGRRARGATPVGSVRSAPAT
jgi:uncharacterized membrane protein SpoIIM required for sporulation